MRNPAGIRAYKKAGFKEIGRRRECRMMGGKLWDEVHMDCLSSEFERPVTPGKEWGFSAWLPPGSTARIEVGTDDGGGPAKRRAGIPGSGCPPGHEPVPGLPRAPLIRSTQGGGYGLVEPLCASILLFLPLANAVPVYGNLCLKRY